MELVETELGLFFEARKIIAGRNAIKGNRFNGQLSSVFFVFCQPS
jgi:hypothetical protein